MAISKRIFGSDIPLKVKQKLAIRQSLNKSADFGEAIDSARSIYPPGENEENIQDNDYGTNFGGIADLSSRTPFARLWTSVKLYKGEKTDDVDFKKGEYEYKQVGTGKESIKTYIIGNHIYNNSSETKSPTDQTQPIELSELLPSELENNEFLKPPAGITSITSTTEGTLGVVKKTTINFTVNNFTDYDKIYSRFFLKPGAQLFVDFGWDTADLYNPEDLILANWPGMGFEAAEPKSIYEALYGSIEDGYDVNGFVIQALGDMETLMGLVTNYDAKIKDNGTVECSVEISSANTALINNDLNSNGDMLARINNSLDNSIMDYAMKRGDNEHIMRSWTKTAKSPEEFKEASAEYGSEHLYNDRLVPIETAIEYGVFWVGDIPKKSGTPVTKQIYISYGVFEDFLLNPEFAHGQDEKGINRSDDAVRFDSSNSFISYDPDVFNYQKELKSGDNRHILYPDNWNDSYSVFVEKTPYRVINEADKDKSITTLDIDVGRIPLREIFINVNTIKTAFDAYKDDGNILDVLKDLFKKIKTDTFDLVDLKLSNNGNSSIVSVVDVNTLDIETNKEEEDNNFKKLFTFKPNSSNSIVKTFDVSFSMPTGNYGNMIAIQSVSSTSKIFPITELLDEALALESFNIVNKLKKDDEITEIERVAIGYLPDIGSYRKDTLATDIEKDSYIGFNFAETFDELMEDAEKYGDKINQMLLTDQNQNLETTTEDTEKTPDEAYWDNLPTDQERNEFYVKNEMAEGYTVADKIEQFWELVFKEKSGKKTSRRNSNLLPLTLNLGIYGISAITPGDVFKVDYLPRRYLNTIYFQIMKVSHNLDSSGWTTNFETQFRIRKVAKIEGGLYKKSIGITLNRRILKDLGLFRIEKIISHINHLRAEPRSGKLEDKLDHKFSFISKAGISSPQAGMLSFPLQFYFGRHSGTGVGEIITEGKTSGKIINVIGLNTKSYDKLKDTFSEGIGNPPGNITDIIKYEEFKEALAPGHTTREKADVLLLKTYPIIKKSENKENIYKIITKKNNWFLIPPDTPTDIYDLLVKILTHKRVKAFGE